MPTDLVTTNSITSIGFSNMTDSLSVNSEWVYSPDITSWTAQNFEITIDSGNSESVRSLLDDVLNGKDRKEQEMEKEKVKLEDLFAVRHIDFGRKTTVYWQDGTQTIVRCAKDTEFSEYAAFTAALAKKIYGTNTAVNKLVRDKDLRKIRAEEKKANLEAQKKRERIAAKKRRLRIKRMAKKMIEENEARRIAIGNVDEEVIA